MLLLAAIKATEVGVAGIIVSNHGARQLDYSPATVTVLEEVVVAVGGKIPVFIDGGIRRGTDIFKALALGPKAVMFAAAGIVGSVAAEYPELRATPPAEVKQQLVGVSLFLAAGIVAFASAATSIFVVAAASAVVAAAAEVAGSCKDSSLSLTLLVPWASLPFATMD
ncbi:hypothetical protein Vadar_009439 [Vaccinium darrowii]|uniref:Uncharacterized protein n=1 Tax=Vaccinium darrowii TaxID=229202 RepID=A0ACB7ZIX1_9ERIC|nr:hypothetical protein Vadar_009439 [Vaccinium darrowii]